MILVLVPKICLFLRGCPFRMGEYEVPLDEQLQIQATEQIVCTDLCMFRDHCDGFCIANQEWKESMLNLLLGKAQK